MRHLVANLFIKLDFNFSLPIGFVTVPVLGILIAAMVSSFHVVDEGHVGIYFKQGALMVIENKFSFHCVSIFNNLLKNTNYPTSIKDI